MDNYKKRQIQNSYFYLYKLYFNPIHGMFLQLKAFDIYLKIQVCQNDMSAAAAVKHAGVAVCKTGFLPHPYRK